MGLIGCYASIGKLDEAQSLLDGIPNLTCKKVAGNRPPTEVFIERKSKFLATTFQNCTYDECLVVKFYKEKQKRKKQAHFVESVNIGLVEGSSRRDPTLPLTHSFNAR